MPADRQTREWPGVMENVADTSSIRRHIDPSLRVQQGGTAEHNAAGIRHKNAADDVYHRAFAAARAPEQGNHTGCRQVESNAKDERAEPGFSRDCEHQRPNMRRTRRANHSDSNSPAKPSITDRPASRAAA